MCGIAGGWNLRNEQASLQSLCDMLSVQHHRGPEDAAYTIMNNGSVLLGFLMLSFTDNKLGMQPLFNEDGTIALVYNGEIYDYEILRDKLIKEGHVFRTQSDSEVLIHLYESYGDDFIQHLNGEFAFVLYDENKKRMFLGRDPFGVKPLYYAMHKGVFYFSSEAKGILATENFPREFNPEYFTSIAVGVPNTRTTLFRNIESLRPGHCMQVNESGVRTYQYWQPQFNKTSDGFETAQAKIRSLVRNALDRRLKGDVPIALALSSGLDSTIIAGLSKELGYDRPVFTLGFRNRSFDESEIAESTSKHFGLRFNHIEMSLEKMAKDFRKSLWHTENSTNSLGNVSRLIMHSAIRSFGLKAVIGGESGDEVFGGYPYFILEGLWREKLKGVPVSKKLYQIFMDNEAKSKRIFWGQSRGWEKLNCPYPSPSYLYFRTQNTGSLSKLIWSDDILKRSNGNSLSYLLDEVPPDACRGYSGFDVTRLMSRSIAATYVFPGIGDRLEMANSLEGRVPFLDMDVVNYAYSLPENYLIDLKNLKGKYILREAFKYLIPDNFSSPPKHTFMSPTFSEFFKTPSGKELAGHYLESKKIRENGILNPAIVKLIKIVNKTTSTFSQTNLFLDSMLGLFLSVQILHELFIEKHPLEMIHGYKLGMKEKFPPSVNTGKGTTI